MKKQTPVLKPSELSKNVAKALKRAGLQARKTARMHGTKVYFMRNGKIVAEKP